MPEKIGRTEAKAEIKKNLDELANRYESENIDPRIREVINDKDNLERLLSVLNNDGLLYLLNRCEEALDGTQYKYGEIFADFDAVFFKKCFPLSDTKDDEEVMEDFILICGNFQKDDALINAINNDKTDRPVKYRLRSFIKAHNLKVCSLEFPNDYSAFVGGKTKDEQDVIKNINEMLPDIYKQKFQQILYANEMIGKFNDLDCPEEKREFFERRGLEYKKEKTLTMQLDSEREMSWGSCNKELIETFRRIYDWVITLQEGVRGDVMQKIIDFMHDNGYETSVLFSRLVDVKSKDYAENENAPLLDRFYEKYIKGDGDIISKLPAYWTGRPAYKNEQAKEVWNNTKANCKILHYSQKDHLKKDLDYFCTLYKRDKAESYDFINKLGDGSKYSISFNRESFENGEALEKVIKVDTEKESSNGMIFYSNVNMFEEAFSEKFLEDEEGEIDTKKGKLLDAFLSKYIITYREAEENKINKGESKYNTNGKDNADTDLEEFNKEFSDANYKDKFEVIFDEEKFKFSKSKNKLDVAIQDSVMLQNIKTLPRHQDWDLGHLQYHEYRIMQTVYILSDLFDPKFNENITAKNNIPIDSENEKKVQNKEDETEKILLKENLIKVIKNVLLDFAKETDTKLKKEKTDKDVIFRKIFQEYKNYEAQAAKYNRNQKGDIKLTYKEIFDVVLEIENELKLGEK